jgi:hypothetical protein
MGEATFGLSSCSLAYPQLHQSYLEFSYTGGQNLVWNYVDAHISLECHRSSRFTR